MSLALCIAKKDLFDGADPDNHPELKDFILKDPFKLFSLRTNLLKRTDCETDETQLQIIPYMTIFDRNTSELFIYRRGKGSTETRLTGMCSIGLGGHIESEPNRDIGLIETIANEAARELNEEVGLPLTFELIETIKTRITCNNCGIIYHSGDSVGRVHIGISMFIPVDKSYIKEAEENIVTRGQWMTIDDLESKVNSSEIQLENWSRIVLGVRQQFL